MLIESKYIGERERENLANSYGWIRNININNGRI